MKGKVVNLVEEVLGVVVREGMLGSCRIAGQQGGGQQRRPDWRRPDGWSEICEVEKRIEGVPREQGGRRPSSCRRRAASVG